MKKFFKKSLSIFLALVMSVSVISGLNFHAYAAEGTDYLSEDDILWFTNKFLYTLTESEKAACGDVLKNMNPDIDWAGSNYEEIAKCLNTAQKYWNMVCPLLPETITKSEILSLGSDAIKYFSCTITFFKNLYYITNIDSNNIEKAYHSLQSFSSICSTFSWNLGPLAPILVAVIATLPLAEVVFEGTKREAYSFYYNQLMIEYQTNSTLTAPEDVIIDGGTAGLFDDENFYEAMNSIYARFLLLQMADALRNATVTAPINEKYYFNGHTYVLSNTQMKWHDAKAYCENSGGHLVTITTADENDFIASILTSNNVKIAIGLTDEETEGVWKWVTGEDYQYNNFYQGEPNNEFDEDYVCMHSDGKWNDGHLQRENWFFICEWDYYNEPFPTINDEHHYVEQVVSPTCTSDGYTINNCVDCGLKYYTGATTKLGHNYNFSNTIASTCTAQGYDLYSCSRCNSTEKRNAKNALGHNYTFNKKVAPTCTAQGYDIYKCSRCTSTENRNAVAATGHNYQVTSNIDATCTDAGLKTETCYNCGDVVETEISATGHRNIDYYYTPTCTNSGGHKKICSYCNEITYETVFNATGHDYGDCIGKDYASFLYNENGILQYTTNTTKDYVNEYTTNSAAIGNGSIYVQYPNQIKLDINNMSDVNLFDFYLRTARNGSGNSTCAGVFAYDTTTGRAPVNSAIPYTDDEGNLVNMKYIDYFVDGNWVNGQYKIVNNTVVDAQGNVVSESYEETRPHIVYTREYALENGIMNLDGTVNATVEVVETLGVSFYIGVPGVYSDTVPTKPLKIPGQMIDALAFDESKKNDVTVGTYNVDICFYHSSKPAIGKLTFKIYDRDELQHYNGNNEYTLTCIDCGETHTETSDNSVANAIFDQIADYSYDDYSKNTLDVLKEIQSKYEYMQNSYASQNNIDKACTELLTAMNELEPYFNLSVTAENGTVSGVDSEATSLLNGTSVTLSAAADDGYTFVGWYDVINNRYLSRDTEYTLKITGNMDIKAVFVKDDSATLTFTTYSNWIQSTVTKTIDEWNEVDSIDGLIPDVPYRYGYSNGRWVYDNAEVLAKLQTGENVSLIPEYDEDATSLPTPPEANGNDPVLELYYKLDAEANVGSFVMAAGIPEGCRIESIGTAFYYKKASEFDPTKFILNVNNKMLVSRFNTDENDDIYITNINKFSSTYNWAVRGYITYYDEDGNLKTIYSNQISIVDKQQV